MVCGVVCYGVVCWAELTPWGLGVLVWAHWDATQAVGKKDLHPVVLRHSCHEVGSLGEVNVA